MKMIVAMIQPEKLTDVKQSLYDAGIHKMTVNNIVGAGQQKGFTETYRGAIEEINLLKKVRIEVVVNDKYVDSTVEAIIKGAKTGNIGDWKDLYPSCRVGHSDPNRRERRGCRRVNWNDGGRF